jgi:hypothetical protein
MLLQGYRLEIQQIIDHKRYIKLSAHIAEYSAPMF